MEGLARRFATSCMPAPDAACGQQRSPLCPPGSKAWLVPHVREWLARGEPQLLIEPFAGGAAVSLMAVMECLVPESILIEKDRDVAAFWRAALDSGESLRERVKSFESTAENLRHMEESTPSGVEDRGFRTLVLNRTMRCRVSAQGSHSSDRQESAKTAPSEWQPHVLAGMIDTIHGHASSITLVEGDAMRLLPSLLHGWGWQAAVFIDPPLAAPRDSGAGVGTGLAGFSLFSQCQLFEMLSNSECNFLMTCDATPQIAGLVEAHRFAAVHPCLDGRRSLTSELVITAEAMFE